MLLARYVYRLRQARAPLLEHMGAMIGHVLLLELVQRRQIEMLINPRIERVFVHRRIVNLLAGVPETDHAHREMIGKLLVHQDIVGYIDCRVRDMGENVGGQGEKWGEILEVVGKTGNGPEPRTVGPINKNANR